MSLEKSGRGLGSVGNCVRAARSRGIHTKVGKNYLVNITKTVKNLQGNGITLDSSRK